MSYDLFFTSPKLSLDRFKSYFSNNSFYKVTQTQAWYSNENTGVYFSFEYTDEKPAGDEATEYSGSFNINYFRPHYFALEAEPEVKKFIDHFGCSIHDYQNDGMGDGPYSREGFLRGWNHGNEFGYNAILGGDNVPDTIYGKPTDELEHIWRWNYHRRDRELELDEDIFIPKIMFMHLEGKFGSVSVWPDGLSTLIPSVDFLYIPRKDLAPRKWTLRKQKDFCILPRQDYRSVLDQYVTHAFGMTAFKLPVPQTPKEIQSFVRSLSPYSGEISGVGHDNVLNLELVQKYSKGRQR